MVGQKVLLSKLNTFTIDTFSHSVLLLGEKGSGKHLISNYIASDILKLPLTDISSNVSDELIDTIYRNPNPSVYIVDLSQITEASQNTLLKFVEEPLNNAFVILLAENTFNVLRTIENRCILFYMDFYTVEELQTFITTDVNKELLLKVARTPGQIKSMNLNTLEDMQNVCIKMSEKLSQASFSNTLSISNKINFKDEYDKFDLYAFMRLLTDTLYNHFLRTNTGYELYRVAQEQQQRLKDARLNKEHFINHLLVLLWKTSRGIR